jgi:chromosome segregation ATPase
MLQYELSQSRGAQQRALKREIEALIAGQQQRAAAAPPPPEQPGPPGDWEQTGAPPMQPKPDDEPRWDSLHDDVHDELSAMEEELSQVKGAAARALERKMQVLEGARNAIEGPPRSAGFSKLEALEAELSQAKAASKAAVKDVVKSTQRVLAAKVKALEDEVHGRGEEFERLARENADLQAELAAAEALLGRGMPVRPEATHPLSTPEAEAEAGAALTEETDEELSPEEAAKQAWLAKMNN